MMRYTLKSTLIDKINIKKIATILFYIVAFTLILGYVIIPLLNTIKSSFNTSEGYNINNYIQYFANKSNLIVIKNTFFLGIMTVLICGIIGTILAFYTSLVDIKNKKILHTLLLSPMMVPGVIIVISFIQLYGESGIITKAIQIFFGLENIPFKFNGIKGILFVHAYTQYVYFYLNVSVALKYLDASTIEAARSFGASKVKIFFAIILPSILPAILSSSIVTFISGISSFSAPNLIGGKFRVLSTQILLSKANNHMHIASVQVVILLIMGLSMLLLIRYYEKKYSMAESLRRVSLKPIRLNNKLTKFSLNLLIITIVTLILLPIIAIFVLSFVKPGTWMVEIFPKEYSLGNYIKLATKPRVLRPFKNSIFMSIVTVLAGVAISLPIAFIISKKKSNLNSLLEVTAMLPWAMPASTIAINLINAFNVKNVFAFNQVLIGRYWILPIAYIITIVPLMLRTNLIALYKFNNDLEDASKSLGAGSIRTFFKITVPIIMPAVVSGASVAFIRTLGEYTMSALLYGVSNRPLSIAMVNAMQEFDIGLSMAYGVITILICTTVTWMLNRNSVT